MLFRIVLLHQELREGTNRLGTTDLVRQLGNEHDMEVLEEVEDLVDVFVLHFSTRNALPACTLFIGEHDLRQKQPLLSPD